jgi:dihydrofolate reductase
MGKVLYSAARSLDGHIAGPGGDMSWLRPCLGPNPAAEELQSDIGALLIGNRTFRGDDPNKGTESEGAYGGTWDGPSFVLTHDVDQPPVEGITFIGDLESALAAARDAAGNKYVCILGADVARQCLEIGQLDEVLAVVVPVFLGDGTRLFDVPGGRSVALETISVTEAPTATNLWMRIARRQGRLTDPGRRDGRAPSDTP